MLINAISKFPNDEGIYEYYENVDSTQLPTDKWEHNPDISNVSGIDQELWKYNGDNIVTLVRDNDLRILKHIPHSLQQDSSIIDFTLLELTASPWEFSRGARTIRTYTDSDDNIVVLDIYDYIFEDSRHVTEVHRRIEWFNGDGTIGMAKDVTAQLTRKKLKELNRTFRQGRMDFLETSAEELRDVADMSPEPYKTHYNQVAAAIEVLFAHYAVVVENYISRGTLEFEQAIENETNQTILDIHDIPVAPASAQFPDGLTAKDSILYQLRGYLVTPGDSDI